MKAMKRKLRHVLARLKDDSKGNILLLAGAGMTVLVGGTGLGVDMVNWYLWKRQMQQAVDTSATAGALSLVQGHNWEAAANSELARTANTAFTVESIARPPSSGDFAGDTGAVEVIATTSRALPFSSLFMSQAPVIRTRAVATAVGVGNPCVRALATSGTGVEVFGGAQVDLDCPVSSNSPGGVSVDVGGSSYLNTDLIMSVGGIDYSEGNVPNDAAIVSYGLPVEDPLADRDMGSKPTGAPINNFRVGPSETTTMNPGTYRNGLTIQGTATLEEGTYWIEGGSLSINSGAVVRLAPGARGVTFVLTNNGSGPIATVSINGGASVDVSATTRAMDAANGTDYAGVLFFQDRSGSNQRSTINGGANINLEGAIYMPRGDLTYNGAATQSAQCLLIVTERVRFGGENRIENDNNCNDDLTAIDSQARVIRVVE